MANFARVLVRYPKESPRFELIVEQAPTEDSLQRHQFKSEVVRAGGEILSPFVEMKCAPLIAGAVLNGLISIQEVRDLVQILRDS